MQAVRIILMLASRCRRRRCPGAGRGVVFRRSTLQCRPSSRRSAIRSRSRCWMLPCSCCSWRWGIRSGGACAFWHCSRARLERGESVTLTAAVVLVFLGLWGLNYRRMPLDESSVRSNRVTRGRPQA